MDWFNGNELNLQWVTDEKMKEDKTINIDSSRYEKPFLYALNKNNKWESKPKDLKLPFIIEWED